MSNQEIVNIMKGRAAIYEFTSMVFQKPVDDNFIGLSSQFYENIKLYGEAVDNKNLVDGAILLKIYADKEATLDKQKLLDELNINFTTLFSLGFSSIANTESSFSSPSGMFRQEEWEATLEIFKKYNYKGLKEFNEPEDHVSNQLMFMHALCNYIADNIESDNIETVMEEQANFIENRLMKWVPKFAVAVIQKSKSLKYELQLYEAVALILKGFVESEAETFNN